MPNLATTLLIGGALVLCGCLLLISQVLMDKADSPLVKFVALPMITGGLTFALVMLLFQLIVGQ